jgi:hypothetical protein
LAPYSNNWQSDILGGALAPIQPPYTPDPAKVINIKTNQHVPGGGSWRLPKMPRLAMNPELGQALRKVGVRGAPALATVIALADAAGELADSDDPMGRNFSEAGGQLGGQAAGATLGAILGLPLAPFTAGLAPVITGGIGAMLGGGPGKQLAGGIYDLVTGYKPLTAEDKARNELMANERTNMLLTEEAMRIKLADDLQRQQALLEINTAYNYQNALNAQRAANVDADNQRSAAMQAYLMGL